MTKEELLEKFMHKRFDRQVMYDIEAKYFFDGGFEAAESKYKPLLDKAVEALEFYADAQTYNGYTIDNEKFILNDQGTKAKQALAEITSELKSEGER